MKFRFLFGFFFIALALALVFIAGNALGKRCTLNGTPDDYMELRDLVESISLPEDEAWTAQDIWFLAQPGTKVHWLDEGPGDIDAPRCCPGLGSVGRKGRVKVRINGKVTTNDLDTVVTEIPWSIGWYGTFKFVTAVFLDIDVNFHDVAPNVPGYLEKLGWAKRMDIDSTLNEDCNNSWYEIKIPHRKKMWMNVIVDCGNSYGTVFITFTFEDLSDSDVCSNFYKDL